MKTPGVSLSALFAGCVAIGACSQATDFSHLQYTPMVNGADREAGPLSYRVLHSFGSDHDAISPQSGLLFNGNAFYGTTASGGVHGWGTVYSITASGAEKVLHSFRRGKPSGTDPYAALIDVDGTLYGTTSYGGAFNYGTVFSVTRDGSEKVLHSFGRGNDGWYPYGRLLDVGGTLYGTTASGGANSCSGSPGGCGTVFSITTSGKEKVLYSFRDGTDGRFPDAGLVDVRGTLYGTTYMGGEYTNGVVFSITTDGREKVLHTFGPPPDGANPAEELIDVNGRLYGTTPYGGTHNGSGTLFSLTTAGKERVLHNFGNGTDGSFPYGSLIAAGSVIYGTTGDGGAFGSGTLFSMTKGGAEKVLHDFGNGKDGAVPAGDLAYKSGSFFGTTLYGGVYVHKHDVGGTVFTLTP